MDPAVGNGLGAPFHGYGGRVSWSEAGTAWVAEYTEGSTNVARASRVSGGLVGKTGRTQQKKVGEPVCWYHSCSRTQAGKHKGNFHMECWYEFKRVKDERTLSLKHRQEHGTWREIE